MATELRLERVLKNDVESLMAVTAELEALLERADASAEAVHTCSLALEEIVTNVIRYGHADAAAHAIRFAAEIGKEHVVLRFEDDGRAFDPLAAPPPALDRPYEERPIGGLGIHLVRKLAERIEYERSGGLNKLTAWFALRPKE